MPFVIGTDARDAWLRCMLGAVAAQDIDEADRAELEQYLTQAADFLVNTES